jgi:hypothetical protein
MDTLTVPYPLAGVQMPAWLLRFDQHGACTSPVTRAKLMDQLRAAPPSDILLFSHGWNEDFDSAAGMYAALLRQFETLCEDHPTGRRINPLFIGIHWPSIWLSSNDGPAIASGGGGAHAEGLLLMLVDKVVASGGVAGRERVFALLAAPSIDDADAAELARLIAPAFGLMSDEGAALSGHNTVADDVLAMMRAMDAAWRGAPIAPPADINNFSIPPDAGPASSTPSGVQMAGGPVKLNPLVALRLFSLFQMKNRAGTVGSGGVAALLRDLLAFAGAGNASGPRVHGIGHSFGCKVLLSAICAEPLPRPLDSLLLLQPAVSHLCFADAVPGTNRPGGYREALSNTRVLPPIISTYSRNDKPLHKFFHLAVRRDGDLGEALIAADAEFTSAGAPPSRFAALGGYGPRRAGQKLVESLPAAGTALVLPQPAPPIVAFDGSAGAINSHGDVVSPAAAWALHQLVFRP